MNPIKRENLLKKPGKSPVEQKISNAISKFLDSIWGFRRIGMQLVVINVMQLPRRRHLGTSKKIVYGT